MFDLITISGIVASLAAINIGLQEMNNSDMFMVFPDPQMKTFAKYFVAVAGVYFFLYAVTQLPKVPKVKIA